MTASLTSGRSETIAPVFYPSGDGQPVAETFDHLFAILTTIAVLQLYFKNQQVCILGNQYLYYEEGNSNKRCAPDVMLIFDVAPGSRDNYKIWEEGQIPRVAFEMTSPSTKKEDDTTKRSLYAEIGILEYWQFDPRGEWIPGKLRGYQLVNGEYELIANDCSDALGLQLQVDGKLIAFYRLDNGEKLLTPTELDARNTELDTQNLELGARNLELDTRNQQLQRENQQLQAELDRYRQQLGNLPD